jgi:hypothetical protein
MKHFQTVGEKWHTVFRETCRDFAIRFAIDKPKWLRSKHCVSAVLVVSHKLQETMLMVGRFTVDLNQL